MFFLRKNITLWAYVEMCRINHWIKNIFLFLPLFFSGKLIHLSNAIPVLIGILVFSLISSSVYIFNDICDMPSDKLHPLKKNRPLASELLSIRDATFLLFFLAIAGLLGSYLLNFKFFLLMLIYLLFNIAYSIKLKDFSLIDIFIIALGFIIRVMAGGILGDVLISHWLYIMTFLISLFMAIGKRRDDIIITTTTQTRKSLSGYTLEFINIATGIICSVLIVSYLMYITSPETQKHFTNKHLYLTSFFVIFGIFRYLQIIFIHKDSGSPTRILLSDFLLQIVIICWIILFGIMIYL